MKPNFEICDFEVYMDNAATTFIDPEVLEAMRPYLEERYGNPETVYRLGREAKKAVEDGRALLADIIRCKPEEIFFTSGGTESNNWAIKGVFDDENGKSIAVSAIEHSSVLEPAKWRASLNDGALPYTIPVHSCGTIDLNWLEGVMKHLYLVSVQYANNEIGTVQPVAKIAELCKRYGVLFHCDAVQAFGKLDFDVDDVGCDMMSLSAHKIHGPMSIGALYIRENVQRRMEPLIHGGGQERGMRSGTLAVPEIVGFAKAAELAVDSIKKEMPRLMNLTEWLAGQMVVSFKAKRNGHPTERVPNIVSVTLPDVETELVCGIMCSQFGTCMSAGAACSTEKRESHVLGAIGMSPRDVLSTMRFSLSKYNTDQELKVAFGRLQKAVRLAATRSLI